VRSEGREPVVGEGSDRSRQREDGERATVGKGAGRLEMKGVGLSAAHAAKLVPGVEQLELSCEGWPCWSRQFIGQQTHHVRGSS
jgi:hypothetical protein